MLEDLIKGLDNIRRFSEQFDVSKYEEAVLLTARTLARKRLREEMMSAVREAIEATSEFQYQALEVNLKENLMDQRHYIIAPDLSFVRIFDEKIAGGVSDLLKGQRAGGGGGKESTHEQRLRCWTYGIYKPAIEGKTPPKHMKDFPAYSEVIDARLQAWNGKAPYWMFLESGNQGGAEAYPSFTGTGFIANVTAKAEGILRKALEEVERAYIEGTDGVIKDQLQNWEEFIPVVLEEVPAPESADPDILSVMRRWAPVEKETYYQPRDRRGRFAKISRLR